MARFRGNQRDHGTLPGGRAPYYGPDAYTTQMNEYDFRQDIKFPGIVGPADSGGRLLENLSFEAGETKLVPHNLRRPFLGVVPLNVRAQPCSFRAYLGTDQSNSSGITKVDLDTESYDRGNVFDVSTSEFTAPLTAGYRFTGSIYVSSSIGSGDPVRILLREGSTEIGGIGFDNGGTSDVWLSSSWEVELSAGDTIELAWDHDGFGTETLEAGSNNTYLAGEIVGSSSPYINSASTADAATLIPIHAERPLTCDLWVY